MRQLKRTLLYVICLWALLLSACGQKAEDNATDVKAEEGRGDLNSDTPAVSMEDHSEEIRISSDRAEEQGEKTEEGERAEGHKIIEDQSFDVELAGWGKVRFVSCEPDDAMDTPHFYLMREGEILYTFPWEDRTGNPGVFEEVRFAAFPDLDGDGGEDAVIGIGKGFETVDSRISYSVVSIYYNRGDRFEPDNAAEDEINARFPYSEAEFAQIAEAVKEYRTKGAGPASYEKDKEQGTIQAMAGSWQLDGVRTEEGMTEYESLREMFGTGLYAGNGLEISENGEMNYYIGIGVGGTGQCRAEGDRIAASVTPYEEHGNSQREVEFRLITEGEKNYLVMDSVFGEEMYWIRR